MYSSDSLVNRIDVMAKSKKVKKIEMLEACGCNRNTLTQLSDKKGLSSFSLARIADYLNCSVDYLLGRTDNPKAHLAPADLDLEAFDPADHIIGVQEDSPSDTKAAQ